MWYWQHTICSGIVLFLVIYAIFITAIIFLCDGMYNTIRGILLASR